MSKVEPLLLLFADADLVTYLCFGCGEIEKRNCANDKKFKSFVKVKTNLDGECIKCKSKNNLFKNPNGQQFWINYKNP